MHSSTTDQLAAAQAALANDPTNAALHVEVGMALFYQERYQEAFAVFQQALALNPNEVGAHNGIGRVHYHLGPPEAAIAAYTRAIDIDPHYVPGYWGLGILYYAQLGMYDQALDIFRLGLERNPQELHFYHGIGHAYARAGRFDEAINAYTTSVQLDPSNPDGHADLSLVYLYRRQYQAAREAMECAIALQPEAWFYRVLGFIHDRLGALDSAIAALERSVALDPNDYEARAGLARVYRATGRETEAAAQLAAGHALAAAENECGRACFESVLGNTDTAIALLEVALAHKQLTPGWARIDPEFTFLQDDPRYQELLERASYGMSREERNKAVVRRYIEEVINQNRTELIDELFAPKLANDVRAFMRDVGDPFPDGYEEICDIVAEGNTVIVRWNFQGTHKGTYLDIPATGKTIEMIGFAVYYLEDGRIADDLMITSNYSVLQQMGVTFVPPES